ncbi:Cellulase (glycosyl hydrolase family 5) [Williamsia sterculiae]|uniref:Cellulase (Glycosyl hydrolase family 5) n=2 Tax=Williamsia sterculiae TaxID=1344003 RepID=A0A1N7CHC5_9NOCA|nr:Cellulase (glycosyl hydrolase family 5) [Williamsia sterculiae]
MLRRMSRPPSSVFVYFRRFVLAVLCWVMFLVLCPISHASAANSYPGRNGIGMNGLSFRDSTSTQNAAAARIAGVGAKWVRIEADWWYVQGGGRTVYDWAGLDGAVAAARSHSLNVLMLIQKTPPWARSTTNGSTPPTNVNDYAAFASKVVARYAPQGITAYEVWNEPNISVFWADPTTGKPNIQGYVNLLKAAYPAMKAATTTPIKVISAGLAPYGTTGTSPDGNAISPLTFLQQMYAANAKNYFDAVGWHPYTSPALPNDTADWNGWSQMSVDFRAADGSIRQKSVRTIMSDNGDAGKGVVMTEAGGPTAGEASLTEDQQRLAYQQAVTARASWDWAGPIFFYTINDFAPVTTQSPDRENYFGVYRYDGTAKPAVSVLQSVS